MSSVLHWKISESLKTYLCRNILSSGVCTNNRIPRLSAFAPAASDHILLESTQEEKPLLRVSYKEIHEQ